jgi:diacylglycerol kinase family enzyme
LSLGTGRVAAYCWEVAMQRTRLNGRTPLFIVVNGACAGAAKAQRAIGDVLRAARRQHYFFTVADANDELEFRRAAHIAARHEGAVIVVGDDAAINAGINATLPTLRPFGVVPLGDVQCASRLPDVPLDPACATEALLSAQVTRQQIGSVNGRCFLSSASVGLHPELLEQRADSRRSPGWWSRLSGMWRSSQRFELELRRGDELQVMETPTLLVANPRADQQSSALFRGSREHSLSGMVVRPVATSKLCWLALRGGLEQLAKDEHVREFDFRRLSARPRSHGWGTVRVLIDGQARWLRPPLVFSIYQHPLLWMTPVRESAVAAA